MELTIRVIAAICDARATGGPRRRTGWRCGGSRQRVTAAKCACRVIVRVPLRGRHARPARFIVWFTGRSRKISSGNAPGSRTHAARAAPSAAIGTKPHGICN